MGDASGIMIQSPETMPTDEPDDDQQWRAQDDHGTDQSGSATPADEAISGEAAEKPPVPMQKRRRVTRACDECRRKKIKCDGKNPLSQPCRLV